MKALILATLTLFSAVAYGDEIAPARQALKVNIDKVHVAVVGQGWPVTEVKVSATFGNACQVPLADELIQIIGYQDNYDTLNLTLAMESDRVCTLEYSPVTVTINLGSFTRPTDGLFSKIVVNDVIYTSGH